MALVPVGVLLIWMGGGNAVTRRVIARRRGPLGGPRSVWMRWGIFLLPDIVTIPLCLIGLLLLVAGALASALG
ncbi:MAG: hypothetical protein LC792_05535 [Actinobacteria bacterium]|nr:hypothetical protein [Actinomycetota bacterium]